MGTQSRLPTCATIPHTYVPPPWRRWRDRSAIDDAAKLPQRQLRRSHSPGRQFGRDPRENPLVREPPCFQLTMTPAHKLLRGLAEVAKNLCHHPYRLALAERTRTSQVVHEFLVRLYRARHRSRMAYSCVEMQDFCPKSGKNPAFMRPFRHITGVAVAAVASRARSAPRTRRRPARPGSVSPYRSRFWPRSRSAQVLDRSGPGPPPT